MTILSNAKEKSLLARAHSARRAPFWAVPRQDRTDLILSAFHHLHVPEQTKLNMQGTRNRARNQLPAPAAESLYLSSITTDEY